jgi:hypothetical protein
VGWIYAFKDRGFIRGVKVGRDGKHPSRFKHAQCYTPRGIDLVAIWDVGNKFTSIAEAEMVARGNLPTISNQNGGAEWLALTAEEAIVKVTSNLGITPEPFSGNPRIISTYDDFRDPKQLKGTEKYRQLLWVYRENKTGLIKVQRTHSWKVPHEPVKTYSILGFKPVACFSPLPNGDIHKDNRMVHSIWVDLVTEFGHGPEHVQVGWLKPEVRLDMVVNEIKNSQLSEITDWNSRPFGTMADR